MNGTMMKACRRVLLLLAALLALQGGALPVRAAAERGPAEYVFTDYGKTYDLESFLNGYNVLSFGNTYLGLHCVGGLLVQGDYDGAASNSGFADGEDMPPSYIRGRLNAPNSVYNSRNHRVDPLYVGASNTVTASESWGTWYYSVNGLRTGNNSTTPVYVSDNFFNFAQAYAVVKQAQSSMQQGSTVVEPDANGTVTIPLGANVTIRTMAGVKVMNLTGDPDARANTTINILEKGDVAIAAQNVNGRQPGVVEQAEEGVSIVWNFPNAESVRIPTQNWLGHIIAPDANVEQVSGNYNGCIICDNLYSSAEGHLYNYSSKDTSWSTVFSVQKIWADGNNADGIRPESIRVQLLANGKPHGKPVTLWEADGWFYLWDKLPETDTRGEAIVYSVREVDVPEGYEVTYDPAGKTLINTHAYETVEVSGTKTWLNEQGWNRPWSITVRLYANGREVESQVVNTSYWGGDNSYSFKNLPKRENGQVIVYTVQEDPVPGYTSQVNGYNLINTFGAESVSVSGTKVWDDGDDADGLRPAEVVIQLLANGEAIEECRAAAHTGWTFTFNDLPEYDANMQKIIYTVREKEIPKGYASTVEGYTITNRHEPETTAASGSKTWLDDNNNDGMRPDSITVILLADMREVARKTVTAADGWKWTFEDLPKYDAGQLIRYSVMELPLEGYVSQADGMNLTNTHKTETVAVSGRKTWNDAGNQDGKRPASITINLLADGVQVASRTVTAADGWMWKFHSLPRFANGKEIVYTITEEPVADYLAAIAGYDVTNTYVPECVAVSGSKTWRDDGDRDGLRPASITIRLLADGREIDHRVVTAADGWAWRFENLPAYENGREIVYAITEDPVPGYTTLIADYDVINTHAAEYTSVSGRKLWFDNDDAYGMRPASVTVYLLANGRRIATRTVTEADGWTWSFDHLPANENGRPIEYTLEEEPVPDYETFVLGYNILNSYDRTSFAVSKIWEGPEGGEIRLTLYADGKRVSPQPEYCREGSMYIWKNLPVFNEDGEEIEYSATEQYMDGYMTVYENVGPYAGETDRAYAGGTIINRGVVNVFVRKAWSGYDETIPKPEIELVLYCNGEATDVPMPAPDKYGWYKYYNLPAMVNGEPARYTVVETKMNGFMAVYTGANGEPIEEAVHGGTITNMAVPATGDTTPLNLWAALLLASGTALVMLRRRRA